MGLGLGVEEPLRVLSTEERHLTLPIASNGVPHEGLERNFYDR
jgi:hypothetical protein